MRKPSGNGGRTGDNVEAVPMRGVANESFARFFGNKASSTGREGWACYHDTKSANDCAADRPVARLPSVSISLRRLVALSFRSQRRSELLCRILRDFEGEL